MAVPGGVSPPGERFGFDEFAERVAARGHLVVPDAAAARGNAGPIGPL
ncbi:hypothetical protein [Amycolatopsis samaneae]|uniref:Uncharacterized protein n=1 Tax=Amycolatopsis samaneae TaxID=664691 RepID=A0ABW5GWB5_9PSEU